MHTTKFHVDVATRKNVEAIENLWRAIAREEHPEEENRPNRMVTGLCRSLESFDFLSSHSFWFLLARSADEAIGYLTLIRVPKPDGRLGTLHVDELRVLRPFRRLGVGSALLQKANDIGCQLGYWRIRLNADQNDPGVCSFYERNGYSHSDDGFFQRSIQGSS